MQIQYLEIVSDDVEAVVKTYESVHGVKFSDANALLGNARTASLSDGGMIGVRAPMGEAETPIVRPYILVEDIEKGVKAAEEAGALIAHPPMELPGLGTFAIYILGGVNFGLWQK